MKGTTHVPSVYIVIRKQGKALFVLRQNTGYSDGNYSVPCGHVEPHETFKQAACREALEETGLHIRPEDLVYKLTVQRRSIQDIRLDVWFEALAWTGEPKNTEPERHAKVDWLELNSLPENVTDFIAAGLEDIRHGQSYAEVGW